MRKPRSNGLVEIAGSKDDRPGFFCMKLVQFLSKEAELETDEYSRLWEERFEAAKSGKCHYTDRCPIYEKTIKNKKNNKK